MNVAPYMAHILYIYIFYHLYKNGVLGVQHFLSGVFSGFWPSKWLNF